MINISEDDKKFVMDNIENGKELLSSDDVNDILDALNYVINRKGFYGYGYNDFGRQLQNVYDRIYNNN